MLIDASSWDKIVQDHFVCTWREVGFPQMPTDQAAFGEANQRPRRGPPKEKAARAVAGRLVSATAGS
jgi:hypothetical protein